MLDKIFCPFCGAHETFYVNAGTLIKSGKHKSASLKLTCSQCSRKFGYRETDGRIRVLREPETITGRGYLL